MYPTVNSRGNKNFTISERLDAIRRQRSETWTEFADFIGISRKYLYMLRRGVRHAGPALERKLREIERDMREQNEAQGGAMAANVAEASPTYGGATAVDLLLLNLVKENAGIRSQLEDLSARLKKIEGGKEDEPGK